MQSVDLARQRYLDMIHRYLQGRLDYRGFREDVISIWAEERHELWPLVWRATRMERCLEAESLAIGEQLQAAPSDPRRLCRMLDRLCGPALLALKDEPFRTRVGELLDAYRRPEKTDGEGCYLAYPPRIAVFERPLPGGGRHHYFCSRTEIRRQLAVVPEYDLDGLWAIGLCPSDRGRHSYGTYFRSHYPVRKPVIVLWSSTDWLEFKLNWRGDPGYISQRFRVELEYGMQIDLSGSRTFCRWPPEAASRFLVEHVLLHEIGHHVQYQQRRLLRHRQRISNRCHEQFAEDYAIRFQRQRKERF